MSEREMAGRDTGADDMLAVLEPLREAGWRVAFTNGCFDILHRGHVQYLEQARSLADMLIVGLNSDDSTRRLKGVGRPVNPQDDRAFVLTGLRCVDHVVIFNEDTPERLISLLRPDVHVKGGDYRVEDLPEAAVVRSYGGDVVIIPFVEGRSTSRLIERLER